MPCLQPDYDERCRAGEKAWRGDYDDNERYQTILAHQGLKIVALPPYHVDIRRGDDGISPIYAPFHFTDGPEAWKWENKYSLIIECDQTVEEWIW